MSFSEFFAKQARKPSGLFGRFVMSSIFNMGNAYLTEFTAETLAVTRGDQVLDIGCGTGVLVRKIADELNDGYVEGVDFSSTMVQLARRKNRNQIIRGRVNIVEGDFDALPYPEERFNKICSVNTIYFWPKPEATLGKTARLLTPGGLLVLAFEDIRQLEERELDRNVFRLYPIEEVKDLLRSSGFKTQIDVMTRDQGKLIFHCLAATV